MLIPLMFIITDAVYSADDIFNIVRESAMQFRNFPRQGHLQYAVLMVLPGNNQFALNPSGRQALTSYNNGDLLLGTNYAVSRVDSRGRHTEIQLLARLPTLLANYKRAHGTIPPAVLLYTRGTPCYGCAGAIVQSHNQYFSQGQYIVAYSTNMQNGDDMTPTKNCVRRNYMWKKGVEVHCVWEPSASQCYQDDTIQCKKHDKKYGWMNPINRHIS